MATERVPRTGRTTRLLHTAVYLTTSALLLTGWWLYLGGEGRPSPLARLLHAPDTRVHVWFGWVLATLCATPIVLRPRKVARFARATFRWDRGDLAWWKRWPAATFTGRFTRHEGRFDPGQRVANVAIVGGLLELVGTGIAMTRLHGGPTFALLAKVHLWTAIALTAVLIGHVVIATGILPGYRGAWRAMHLGGRVDVETARRIWPVWTERRLAEARDETPSAAQPADAPRGSTAVRLPPSSDPRGELAQRHHPSR